MSIARWIAPGVPMLLTIAIVLSVVELAQLLGWRPARTAEPVVAMPAPALVDVPKLSVPVPKGLKVYAPEAVKKLAARGAIPREVAAQPSVSVVAATEVAPSERGSVVTSVVDAGTGEVTTYEAPAPLPWFKVENRGRITLAHGVKGSLSPYLPPKQVTRLSVHQDVIQIKGVHLGVVGSIDSDGTYFSGVGLSYKW